MQRTRLPYLLLPLAALVPILPLLVNGCSCGHDFDFHLLNWFEAARQFTHGNLHPHWATTAAWNAGEPRFVFYPPASWTLGALLGLLFPWAAAPILFTWLALTSGALALHRLAREFTTPTAALLASVFYLANPYMLFTAYERTAYAELLAAAWIPLLLHAILRRHITIPRIAIPLALLWLTNAPAAVMSSYALALLAALRLITSSQKSNHRSVTPALPPQNPGAPYLDSEMWASRASATAPAQAPTQTPPQSTPSQPTKSVISTEANHALTVSRAAEKPASPPTPPVQSRLEIAANTLAGTTLGLGLAAFYILPAAYERRFVQIAMALLPGMRIQDNFLFHHTDDIPHDQVLHTASLIALLLITLTATALLAIRRASTLILNSETQTTPSTPSLHPETKTPPDAAYLDSEMWASRKARPSSSPTPKLLPTTPLRDHQKNLLLTSLTLLTATITLLLTPISNAIWQHTPELAFLQFPWRLLALIAAVLSLTLALALRRLHLKPTAATAAILSLAASLTWPAYIFFHQPCDPEDTVSARLALFHSNQGSEPTDEYTPTTADNDALAPSNPPYWLSPNPDTKAPTGLPPGPSPTHLTLNSPTPQTLILNLRDYPAWRITLNNKPLPPGDQRSQRDDGLLTLPLPAGPSTLTIDYAQPPDQTAGDAISLLSLITLLLLCRSRHSHSN